MGAVHSLRVKSSYQLLKIENIKIENKPNEHGYLYLKCLIDHSINFQSAIMLPPISENPKVRLQILYLASRTFPVGILYLDIRTYSANECESSFL